MPSLLVLWVQQQIIFILSEKGSWTHTNIRTLRGLNMQVGPYKERKNPFELKWTNMNRCRPSYTKGGGHNWPKWTKMKDTDWLTWPMSRPPCYLTSIVSSLSLNPVINSPDQPSDMNPIMKHASKIQIQKIQLQFLLHFSALFKWLPCSLWPRTFSHFLNSIVGFWFFISAAQHFHLWQYYQKSWNGDTLGPVELIVWPEQGNQGDWREQDG